MNITSNEPNLVLSDLDGTLFRGNATRLLFDKAYERKFIHRTNVAQGMFVAMVSRPLPYSARLQLGWNTMARLFKGKSYQEYLSLCEDCAEYIVSNLFQEVLEQIKSYKATGAKIVIVSASPDEVVRQVVKLLDFDDAEASQLQVSKNGLYLTGRTATSLCYGTEKVYRAQLACTKLNQRAGEPNLYNLQKAVYFADDASDYYLLSKVGTPIVVNPSPEFYEQVQEYKWQVLISAS